MRHKNTNRYGKTLAKTLTAFGLAFTISVSGVVAFATKPLKPYASFMENGFDFGIKWDNEADIEAYNKKFNIGTERHLSLKEMETKIKAGKWVDAGILPNYATLVHIAEYTPNSRWYAFENTNFTPAHKATMDSIKANLKKINNPATATNALNEMKTGLSSLQADLNKTLGRPQVLVDTLLDAVEAMDKADFAQWGYNEENQSAWIGARTALTSINKQLRLPNSIIVTLVNGFEITSNDQQATIRNGRTLVPLRAVANALHMDVKWHDESRTASFTGFRTYSADEAIVSNPTYKGNVLILTTLGSDTLRVYTSDNPADLIAMRDELAKIGSTGDVRDAEGVLQVVNDNSFTLSSKGDMNIPIVQYKDIKMDTPVQSINGRTMLPIRYFMEAYSPYSRVEWKSLGDVRGNGTHYGLVSVMSNGLIPYFSGVDISKLGGRNAILSKQALEMFAKETTDYMKELDPRYQDMYKVLSQMRTPEEIVALRQDPSSPLHQMVNMTPIHDWKPSSSTDTLVHKPIKIDSPSPTDTVTTGTGVKYNIVKYYQGLPLEMWYTFVRLSDYDRGNLNFAKGDRVAWNEYIKLMQVYEPIYKSSEELFEIMKGAGSGYEGIVPVSDIHLVKRLSNYDITMTVPLIIYLGQGNGVIDYIDMDIYQFKKDGGMRVFDAMQGKDSLRETNYEK